VGGGGKEGGGYIKGGGFGGGRCCKGAGLRKGDVWEGDIGLEGWCRGVRRVGGKGLDQVGVGGGGEGGQVDVGGVGGGGGL